VHAAEVTEDVAGLEVGQRVAVKVIHPHLLGSPGFFKRFMREAELGRKVVHENVVRTFDVDATELDDKVIHYMVMEYVEGRSLRELLDDLGTIPETLLREIALQTSAGLVAIHAQGIVHRDLKPENILITDDHTVRILDMGVAKLQETSIAITEAGQFAGSLIYSAPEQFGPDGAGASVDLYALGVTLFELATGENPFLRDAPAAIIQAQLKVQPPPVTDLNSAMTVFLAELVATLLAKKPGDRFASAEALRTVLQEAERSPWWVELAPKLRKKKAHLPRIRVRRETKLHGRSAELCVLNEAWRSAREGEGGILFLEGEAGIGRTRLLDAFLRELEETEIHVLYGSYPPSGGLGGISDAIIEKFGEVDLAGALAPYLTATPSLVPGFAGWMKREVPPAGTEPLQADALRAVCVHLMRALAGEKPLIWLVEDLHFAPKESRDTVLTLARAVEGHRVLLVATARAGLPGDEISHFSRLENFQRLTLGRLGAREVAELLEDAFKSEALAEKLGLRIAKKSDGVPFFILEMIRGLKDGQFIRQEADGSYVQTQRITDIEVPSAVKDLIQGRLRGLNEVQRAVLDVGSVQGMVFDAGLTAKVLDEKKVNILRQIAEIERRSGLVRGEAASCRFDQNQIQEVLYGDLIPELRSEYHTLLAEAHAERIEGAPAGEDALFLASHGLQGSQPESGVPHLLPALDHLERFSRNEAAIDLAARALDAQGLLAGELRTDVLLRKAGRHNLRGERELERAALDEALALADGSDDAGLRARVRRSLGSHLRRTAEYAAAQTWFEQALDLARKAGDKRIEGEATGELGSVFHALGRYDEARAQHEKHLALAREIGDPEGEAQATGNLGTVFFSQRRYDEARAQHEKHLVLARALGNREGEARATGGLANVLFNLGRVDEALARYEEHLALAREIGDRSAEARTTGNLGSVLLKVGRSEDAYVHYEKTLALTREIGDRRGEAYARGGLGSACWTLGRFDEVRAHLEKSAALSREIGDLANEATVTGNLGVTFRNLGRFKEARPHFERWLTVAREIGDRQTEGIALLNLGPLQAALGQSGAAQETLRQSLRLLGKVGARGFEGYALHELGSMAEQSGDLDEARGFHEQALELRRDISYTRGVAWTLVALGRMDASRGSQEAAAARIDEALALAEELKDSELILSAMIERGRMSDGDVPSALAALEEHEGGTTHQGKMAARFRLWELTSDMAHLEEAHRLLCFVREHAPEDCRDSMIENVPLHRDILKAWEEHGEKG